MLYRVGINSLYKRCVEEFHNFNYWQYVILSTAKDLQYVFKEILTSLHSVQNDRQPCLQNIFKIFQSLLVAIEALAADCLLRIERNV